MTDVRLVIRPEAAAAETAVQRLTGSLRQLGAVAAGAFAVERLTALGQAVYSASVNAERLATMLQFSSARGSAAEMAFVGQEANRLGLELRSTAAAYGSFIAAARGTALEGAAARNIFSSVASSAAVMGLSVDQTSGVLLALQQMISKGVVSAEELRGQLGERLPGAFQVAARAIGVTTQQLGEMLERGEVLADDFLPRFAQQLRTELGDAAETAADRLEASANRMTNAWDRLLQNLGKAGGNSLAQASMDTLRGTIDSISDAIEVARVRGDGWLGQLVAGAGQAAARLFALQLALPQFRTLDLQIAAQEAKVAGINQRLANYRGRVAPTEGQAELRAEAARLAELVRLRQAIRGEDPEAGFDAGLEGRATDATRRNQATAARVEALRKLDDATQKHATTYAEAVRTIAAAAAAGDITQEAMLSRIEQQRARLYKAQGNDGARAAAAQDKLALQETENLVNLRLRASRRELEGLEADRAAGLVDLNRYAQEKAEIEQRILDDEIKVLDARIAAAQRADASGPGGAARRRTEVLALQDQRAALAEQRPVAQADAAFDRLVRQSEQGVKDENVTRTLAAQDAARASSAALVDANRQAGLSMIRDDRARGQAQIRLWEEQELAKIEVLRARPADYAAAQEAINTAVTLKTAELTERLKPEWQRMLEDWQDTTRLMADAVDNTITGALKAAEEAAVQFATTGKLNIRSLVNTIIAEFARAQARQGLQALFRLGSDLLAGANNPNYGNEGLNYPQPIVRSASGSAFGTQGLERFAQGGAFGGQVVQYPTLFRFAQGGALRNGLMGEAGPEAIMPLARDSTGRLGVQAQGGQAATYNIVVQGDATAATVRMIQDALARYDRSRRRAER